MNIFKSIGNAFTSVFKPIGKEAGDALKETGQLIASPFKAVDNLFSKDETDKVPYPVQMQQQVAEQWAADEAAEAGPTADGTSLPQEARVFERPDGKTIIQAGRGQDDIEVTKDEEGNIHVTANGEEVWSGTAAEFEDVIIKTGRGDDRVKSDGVDNLSLRTGRGDDKVKNRGDDARIGTGRGDDKAKNRGDDALIKTRRGDDHINTRGDAPDLRPGRGRDEVIG